jgi:hypothetical protein
MNLVPYSTVLNAGINATIGESGAKKCKIPLDSMFLMCYIFSCETTGDFL